MTQMAIDVLAFTGHKSLYGLAGIGGLAFSERGAEAVKPLITAALVAILIPLINPLFTR